MPPVLALVLAALILAPVGALAADLVVWWEKGFNPEEDAAIVEVIGAFEQKTGQQVELVLVPQDELPPKVEAALDSGSPPDLAFGNLLGAPAIRWAHEGRLVDLSATVAPVATMFDPGSLERWTRTDEQTGRRALYGLPVGRTGNNLHAWRSLLEEAGFTLDDIPGDWELFWAFWCDQVQPAVRKSLGRDDIWGIGQAMSAAATADTEILFRQFVDAYQADYVVSDGRLLIDDPEVRHRLVLAMTSFISIWRKGCTPPDSLRWTNLDNNKAFLAQRVVMTPNQTLSIPNTLRQDRPDDYYRNTRTIEWPLGPSGNSFPLAGWVYAAVVLKDGHNVPAALAFARFLVEEGWLAHYLNFSAERFIPPLPALLDQPFWLDTSDQHRMMAVMQLSERGLDHDYVAASGDWRHAKVSEEHVWAKAIRRVAAEGISPEQAVDEAIARIKQILAK
jgi:multiple sugar transport system substrate-binding protein